MNTKRRTTKKRREPKTRKRTISLSLPADCVDTLKKVAHDNYRNLSGMAEVIIREYGKQNATTEN